MKLPRPYIPLSVRIAVAERQLRTMLPAHAVYRYFQDDSGVLSKAARLSELLEDLRRILFADALQLDHDPALALRRYNPRFKNVAARYFPNANNSEYLHYRAKDAHRTKTFLRGEHGQRSDIAQIKRERRRARPKKAKRKIAQRVKPWPKGRKMQRTRRYGEQR